MKILMRVVNGAVLMRLQMKFAHNVILRTLIVRLLPLLKL